MSKLNENQKRKIRLYILSKKGQWIQPKIIKFFVDYITKDAELVDFGIGNAYNMPDYLLGVIEDNEKTAMIVAWDWDDDIPHPRVFSEHSEICHLIEALKANPDRDSWDIAVAVNKEIRAAQK